MKIPDDCTVRMVDLPVECGGMVSLSPDGHFNIYLNARLDRATQREKFLHELRHILNDDFFSDDDIRTVESRADAHATPRHRLPPLFKASDLLKSRSKSLPPVGKVGRPKVGSDEVPGSPVPPSPIPNPAPQLSPHQTAVLLRAISDLDDWLFNPRCDF